MAEGTDTGAETNADGSGNGGGGNGGGEPPKTFTQAQVNDLIAKEKGKIQGQYADYEDLKAAATQLAEIEESKKTVEEKLAGERDALRGQTETLTQQNARLKVALKKGLVGERAELADLLQGKNEKEMEAHADKLLALIGSSGSTSFDGGARDGGDLPQDMNARIRRASGRA